MKTFVILSIIILSTISNALGHFKGISSIIRHKRDAVGALDIVTNHAQPIHAEVKPETQDAPVGATEAPIVKKSDPGDPKPGLPITEKPCPEPIKPSRIEPGVVFKVTPPEHSVVYDTKPARRSWPLTNKLEFIRNVTRTITLFVLILSAVVEFFPLIQQLYFLYYL